MLTKRFAAGLVLAFVLTLQGQAAGLQQKVQVEGPTRLDWTYVLSDQSLPKVPADWLKNFDSTKQTYDLFVPESYNASKPAGLILFVSAGNGPAGQKNFEAACNKNNLLFASPYNAGNGVDTKQRVRIVLDVLDDVRKKYNIDPDRTYIAGFSGGGRIACGIAFALPELFGGVIGVCASGNLRDEPYLRHRVMERLNVAFLTGENDFNRGEVERFRTPMLEGVGVEAKSWVFPGMGHAIPNAAQLQEVVDWLDQGVKKRQELAKKFPASRLVGGKMLPAREEQAKALFAEGQKRMEQKETFYSGLMQLLTVMKRYRDLPIAKDATKILTKYDAMEDHHWKDDDIAEQRRFLLSEARAITAYATGDLPKEYEPQRGNFAKEALLRWNIIIKDAPADSKVSEEAKKQIPVLQKLVKE
ncbi:MAG: hypothetical protein AB7K24_17660 [Gemmataceae bacterium]